MLSIKNRENLDVEPFDEVAEQLLDDELDDSLIYYYQLPNKVMDLMFLYTIQILLLG